jgi:hypothetical protein
MLEDTAMKDLDTKDPRSHAANVRETLDELISHLRRDIGRFTEPKAQALFETAAEVLTGLRTAVDHYERQAEPAMTETAGRQ